MAELNIAEFYRGRRVLITGGTGFIGKLLIEKLLCCCPDIERIYLLIRPLQNKDVDQRRRELIDNEVFKLLSPQVLDKIEAVPGDVTLPGYGLSLSNLQLLIDHVSIVFNVAATGALEENLKEALETNVQGPTTLLGICRKMKQLQALVHVSTVLNHLYQTDVEECVYQLESIDPVGINASSCDVIKLMEDKNLNAYTFTKVLAERILEKERGDIPLVIVRPSIVIAAAQEPFNLESIHCMTETRDLMLRAEKVFASDSLTCDMIPVDHVVNLIIAVAWYTALNRPEKEAPVGVYICSSNHANQKLTRGSTTSWNTQLSEKDSQRSSGLYRVINKAWLCFNLLVSTYLLNVYCLMALKRPKWVQSYRRFNFIEFFSFWKHSPSNDKFTSSRGRLKLLNELSDSDRQTFYFDSWDVYLENLTQGTMNKFKKGCESTQRAEKRKNMVVTHWINTGLLLVILAYFWLNLPESAEVTVLNRLDSEPVANSVISNCFEMLQTLFSQLHIVIAAVVSFAYIFVFIPAFLVYAVYKFMQQVLIVANNFINIPEVKQVIKMCTM